MNFARDQNRKRVHRQHGASPVAWKANKYSKFINFAVFRVNQMVGPGPRDDTAHKYFLKNLRVVPRGGIEPPTPAFSVQCSTN
jgi:hypothetical protein